MPILYGTNFDDILYGTGEADELYAGDGADQVYAGAGADYVVGGAGNDYIDGGAGADYLRGGLGDDLYIVDNSSDYVYENGGEGYDAVYASVNYQLSDDIEALVMTGSANLVGRGNYLANYLAGNAGNNVLDGGLGDDIMAGGLGDDVYYVQSAGDYVYEAFGAGIDTVVTKTDYYMPDNVENLIGDTPYAFLNDQAIRLTLFGNGLDNVIRGGGGGGWIYGGGGDDVLSSGSNEIATILYGGEGNDVLSPAGIGAAYGGRGDDTYIGGYGGSIAENAGEGIDTVIDTFGGGNGSDELTTNIENLIVAAGASAGASRGNSLDNRMTGASQSNTFYGLAGNDTLSGGGGNDVLYGDQGDDWLVGGAGADQLIGGAGADRFVFANGDMGTTLETADRIQDFSAASGDRIDLTGIDANVNLAGDQAFAFISTASFSGVAGQLRYELLAGQRYLQADVNGDGAVDFWLRVDAFAEIASDHFLL